ncbi:hypothetical protein, partial [Bacillus safensis]|uniref:hypothetical protein n=1 Tax=Bacillus safensis TaxID=561879 RepID=UPI001CCBD1F5
IKFKVVNNDIDFVSNNYSKPCLRLHIPLRDWLDCTVDNHSSLSVTLNSFIIRFTDSIQILNKAGAMLSSLHIYQYEIDSGYKLALENSRMMEKLK